jgi:hypothetical protein
MINSKTTTTTMYRRISEIIVSTHENPNDWNMAVRRLVEQMGFGHRLPYIAFHASLASTTLSFMEEMAKQGKNLEDIERALQECFGPFTA